MTDQPNRLRPPAAELSEPAPALAVWPTGQRTPYAQLVEGGYLLPDTARDPAAIPPDIAAHAITTYTRPGGGVLDPDCGAGAVLVEAARTGRAAVGLTGSRHWHQLATANLAATGTTATVIHTTGHRSDPGVPAGPGVDLVLTAARSRLDQADRHRGSGPSPDPDQLAESMSGLRAVLARCRPLLHPGSRVLVVCRTRRPDGYLLDLPTAALAAGRSAGLVPVDRCIALLAPITGDRLAPRASLAHRRAVARHQRVTGHPITLTAHLTVLVFALPPASVGQAGAAPAITSAAGPRRCEPRPHPDQARRGPVGGSAGHEHRERRRAA